jgi:Flp pilus assembly protein TadG
MKFNDQRGAALVEMAIVLPLLALLVFGAIEFGRAVVIKNTLNYLAREGARRASISDPFDVAAIQSFVSTITPSSLQSGVSVNVTPTVPVHHVSTVTVTVTTPFTTALPSLLPMLKNITLDGQASMLYE